MDRPLEAAHRVATVERAGQELVLRADKDPGLLWPSRPFVIDRTAHELMNADIDLASGLGGLEVPARRCTVCVTRLRIGRQ